MIQQPRVNQDLAPAAAPPSEAKALRNIPFTAKKEEFHKLTAKRFIRPALAANDTLASAWNEALCCEARNSLQVVLSGAEILLEDHLGNLQPAQKALLAKMMDNAYHLCNLMATLAGPDEFRCEQIAEDDVLQLIRQNQSGTL